MGKSNHSDVPHPMNAWAYTISTAGQLTLNAVVPHKGQAQDWIGKRVIIHPLTDDGQMSEQIADAVIGDICEVTASTDHIRSMDANITAGVDQTAKIRIGIRYRITTVDGADAGYVKAVEQATQATVPLGPVTITTAAGEVARIHDHAILADSNGVWVLENGQWQPITNLAEQRRQLLHRVAIVNGKELRAYDPKSDN